MSDRIVLTSKYTRDNQNSYVEWDRFSSVLELGQESRIATNDPFGNITLIQGG